MSAPLPIDDFPFGADPFDNLMDCATCGAEFVERRWGGSFAPSAYCSPECEPDGYGDVGWFS